MNRKRALIAALLLILLAAATVMPGLQLAGGMAERLTNGTFEEGFDSTQVGLVGAGWGWFHSGGDAHYGFYRDQWAPVVYDGGSSQLIEINTVGYAASSPNHYAGIYQTVAVVPGSRYTLTLNGMLRSLEDDPDRRGYNYRVQYGIDYDGGTAWETVDNWVELPWDTVHPRLSPGPLDSYSTGVVAQGDRLTLFIRVWYKWGTGGRELDVNLDGIGLKGALPADSRRQASTQSTVGKGTGAQSAADGTYQAGAGKLLVSLQVPSFPVAGWTYAVAVQGSNDVGVTRLQLYDNGLSVGTLAYEVGPLKTSHEFGWTPSAPGRHVLRAVAYDMTGAKASQQVTVRVGEERQFLANGGFENGFAETSAGLVGNSWGWFENGGRAAYRFSDDTWGPTVSEGGHSQLIEINTNGQAGSDPDRYAGLWQTVQGLTKGATYRLSLQGMLRAWTDDADREGFGYRVQWGYAPNAAADWTGVTNWTEIPWNTVYGILEPGEMDSFGADFEAPSKTITLFIRAWKKNGTVRRELEVNLDGIALKGYK